MAEMSGPRFPRDAAPELDVEALPRRMAHAVHALFEASGPYAYGMGILTAAEIVEYDAESFSARQTGAALREAAKLGLVAHVPPDLWTPTMFASRFKHEFETRYLRETEEFFNAD